MPDIAIRPATVADIPAITAIYADAVVNGTASYELEPPGEAEMTARFKAVSELGYPYLVARTGDGSIVGYAYAGPFRPRRAYRFMVEDSIYLAPSAQGRGLGRLLLARLIEEATACGFRQMAAVIGDGARNLGSVKLHEALGFRHVGQLLGSGFKHERWLDTIFMQLALNEDTDAPPDPASLPERNFRHGL
ncbi:MULTISPECIES: GNAT family N-acetyltransferase [Nitratireductor]|uniref:GNAT family N-acetyltransferase n=1 Tax=Nitratireductor TaxID=245876 RepID=UPI000D0CDD77|nr:MULTISPECIES: GNAT family N-acetyltransferase [Nitratireductor]PSM19251.1 GNAT family N-acetyltransferase [Nitratireductor sp. StC3]